MVLRIALCGVLLLCWSLADAQRRPVRVDAGAWEPDPPTPFADCEQVAPTGIEILRQGSRFIGSANAGLRDSARCQTTAAGFDGEAFLFTVDPDLALAGLIGPNANAAARGIRYSFPAQDGNLFSPGSFQWSFFDIGRLTLIALNGDSPLQDARIVQDGKLLWDGGTDGYDGEYFCFSGPRYLGTWNGRGDDHGACLRHLLARALPAQAASRNRFGRVVGSGYGNGGITADARHVAFETSSNALWLGEFGANLDTNDASDVFVFDRQLGQVRLLSRNAAGNPANGASRDVRVAPGGNLVVFSSEADDLEAGGSAFTSRIVLHDIERNASEVVYGTTAESTYAGCVAPQPNGDASQLLLTCREFAFSGTFDVLFFHHLVLLDRRSQPATESSFATGELIAPEAAFAGDGGLVAFRSGLQRVPADTNAQDDIYLLTLDGGGLELVSRNAAGVVGNAESRQPAISADGCRVAFASSASNLVPADGNGVDDVFVRDRCAATTLRASVRDNGAETDGESRAPTISADGRFVAFETNDSALRSAAGSSGTAIAVRDLALGRTRALAPGSIDGESFAQFALAPRLSADGHAISVLAAGDLSSDVVLALNSPFGPPLLFRSGFELP